MPLFDKIRKQTDSTFARVLFVLIVLTFVFWGVVNPNAPQATTLAEVNGVRILNTQVNQLASQYGGDSNKEEEEEQKQIALQALITAEAMTQEATEMGIRVSNKEKSYYLLQDKRLEDENGFNSDRYEKDIKGRGFQNKALYEEVLEKALIADKLLQIVSKGSFYTTAQLKNLHYKRFTTYEASVVKISELNLKNVLSDTIKEEEIDIELNENEEGIRATYEKDLAAKYKIPQRVKYEEAIVGFGSDQPKEEAKKKIESLQLALNQASQNDEKPNVDTQNPEEDLSGQANEVNFSEIAKTQNIDFVPASVGVEQENFLSEKIGQAAFELETNTFSEIIETEESFHIIRVTEKIEKIDKEFDDVKRDIAKESVLSIVAKNEAERLAKEIKEDWKKSPKKIRELIANESRKPLNLKVEKTRSPFSALQAAEVFMQTLGVDSNTIQDEFNKNPGVGLLEPQKEAGGWVIVRINKKTLPTEKEFAKRKEVLKAQVQLEFVVNYQQDLLKRAEIDNRLEKQKQQQE